MLSKIFRVARIVKRLAFSPSHRALVRRMLTATPEDIAFSAASTVRSLERVKTRNNIKINTIIDIGASDGRWSESIMHFFPKANYILVEAQSVHLEGLKKFCKKYSNSDYILAAAGDKDGYCFFDDSEPLGGAASNEERAWAKVKLPMVKVDSLVKQKKLQPPYLLKLDTHGFELEIINGANNLLKQTELLIIEAYIFRLHDKAMLFYELCFEMDKRGFRLIDFSEPLWRPKDMALWQWDLFFIKKDNPVFNSNSYA